MNWEVVVGIPVTIIACIIGVLGYKASVKRDAVSARTGIASENREGLGQRLEILDSVIDTLQEERADLREQLKSVVERLSAALKDIATFHEELKTCEGHVITITKERDLLSTEVERLHNLYAPKEGGLGARKPISEGSDQ